MTFDNTKTGSSGISLAAIAALAIVAASPTTSIAAEWEMRTVDKEVPGTREIEAGNAPQAIHMSEMHLQRSYGRREVAILTNLCIGHVLLSQFDKAEGYCTEAAQKPYEGDVTSNNLGVFRALQGNMTAAHDDFSRAAGSGCENDCSAPTVDGAEIASSVARRNIKKLEEEGYASVASDPVQKVTAQNRQ